MTEALFAKYGSIPGAPAAGDPGWAPVGSTTSGFSATPNTGRAIDHSKLTPEQRHGLKAAIASGDQATYEAWERSLQQPNTAAGPVPPGGDVAGSPGDGGPAGEPAPDPYDADFDPEAIARFAEVGAHPYEVSEMEPLFDRFADHLLAMPEDRRAAAVLESEERMIHRVYRGNEDALRSGLHDIKQAAELLGLDIAEIDASGALADPAIHQRALLMARRVLANRKP